jgi:hypothetical protein
VLKSIILFGCGSVFLLAACAQAEPVVSTSVCELANVGQSISGRRVHLVAVYTTDLLEHSSLNDPRCPKKFLEPFDPKSLSDPTVAAFDKAVIGNPADLRLRQFKIDTTGRFESALQNGSSGRFYIEKIWSFKRL